MTGVCYNSLLTMCMLNRLEWFSGIGFLPDLLPHLQTKVNVLFNDALNTF